MGQYFQPINTDKKEYVCPWCIGGGAKLWEWAANCQGAIFTLLLRKSTEGGGGDFSGRCFEDDPEAVAGRWAGDRVMLVGDYDDSQLWDQLPAFRNISKELATEWNHFINLPDRQLKYKPCSQHQ